MITKEQAEIISCLPHYERHIRQSLVPDYMWYTIAEYLLRGRLEGDFLTAVLTFDLLRIFQRADNTNIHRIKDYALLLYNVFPPESYGSKENVKAWCEGGGLYGLYAVKREETTQ